MSKFFVNKNTDDDDPDDSLKYFKSVSSAIKKPSTSTSQSTTSAVSGFINNKSSPKKVIKKSPKKTTRKPAAKKKQATKPDIRKLLSKDDQLIHKVLEESCREDNLDPDDVQLAIALSESMKEQQQQPASKESKSKLENPFKSGAKVQSVASVLERFGFKSGKNLSEFEKDLLTSSKFKKRSKFQKAPTVLTRTTNQEREELILGRINNLMDQKDYKDDGDQVVIDFDLQSTYLQDLRMQYNGIARLENLPEPCDNFIQYFYVTDLFQPSFVEADHLLKDWNSIPGRDRSPRKKILGASENENEENSSSNSSSSDIFAGIDSFSMDDIGNVSQQLDILHEKLSNTCVHIEAVKEEKIIEKSHQSEIIEKLILEDESLEESDHTIEYELEIPSSAKPQSPMHIDIVSSDDEADDLPQAPSNELVSNEICDLTQVPAQDYCDLTQDPELSQSNSSEVINISDDEINYSMQAFEAKNDSTQFKNDDIEIMEIENISNGNSPPPVTPYKDFSFKEILNETSELLRTPHVTPRESINSNQSMKKFLAEENLSDSIQEIIKKYGGKKSESPRQSSFRKQQSESFLNLNNSGNDNVVDLTQNDEVLDISPEPLEISINQSLTNIMNSPSIVKPRKSLADRKKSRKSLMSVATEKYEIDTENVIPEPDFKNMTPAELKQELFKYGIRPLSVKKAVELLQHIHNSIHPKIRVIAEEEIDVNDSRLNLNFTDVVSNIASNGDDDDFVFQYKELDGEEYITPGSRKSKVVLINICLIY